MTTPSSRLDNETTALRRFQWSALVSTSVILLLFALVVPWAARLDTAVELGQSMGPEHFDAAGAVASKIAVGAAAALPFIVYEVIVMRSLWKRDERLFIIHSIWMLILVSLLPLAGLLLQPSDSALPVGREVWCVPLVVLSGLLVACVRALRKTELPRSEPHSGSPG